MGAFHTQSFSKRFATMGDPAENVFCRVHPKSHALGLNRPNFTMQRMTDTMKHTPDKMTADGIYECMGMGRDGRLKLKTDKLKSLLTWQVIGPVNLFVYDQANEVCFEANIMDWHRACHTHGTIKTFENDGNEYFELERIFFPCDPQEIPDEPAA